MRYLLTFFILIFPLQSRTNDNYSSVTNIRATSDHSKEPPSKDSSESPSNSTDHSHDKNNRNEKQEDFSNANSSDKNRLEYSSTADKNFTSNGPEQSVANNDKSRPEFSGGEKGVHVSINRRIEMPPDFLFPEDETPPSDLLGRGTASLEG